MVFVKLTPMIIALTLSEDAMSFSNVSSFDKVCLGIKLSFILSIFIVLFSNSFSLYSNPFIFFMINAESILSWFVPFFNYRLLKNRYYKLNNKFKY